MDKSFLERLRVPDEDFLLHLRMLTWAIPFGITFLIMIVLLIMMAITKIAGTEIPIPRLYKLLILLAVMLPSAILRVMRGYVSFKLKKKELL